MLERKMLNTEPKFLLSHLIRICKNQTIFFNYFNEYRITEFTRWEKLLSFCFLGISGNSEGIQK